MDHAEARELLDVAALEPGGLDRMIAGDTPSAIALAGHLAGCPDCTEEFSRLRRSASILRSVIATQPPAELKERTLEFVAAVGRPRGREVDAAQPAPAPAAPVPAAQRAVRAFSPRAFLAAAAAIVVLSVGLTAFTVGSQRDSASRQMSLELAGLAQVAQWTARLDAQPDVRHVVLTRVGAGSSGEQVGLLVFSASTRKLVVVADGLDKPPDGKEYGCWVELAGDRQRLGKMYVSGDLGYWVGDSEVLSAITTGSKFGVSLVDTTGAGGGSTPVMSGTLQAT